MASGWLNHKQLMIVKGIGKTPGDTNSAEPDPIVFNLMAEDQVSLTPNGWTPQIASVKNGGVWADSPISDGRQLLTAPVGNVTEKIEILITDNSYLGVMKQLASLYQMAQFCRDNWQTQGQIDPVYLLWYAGCGAGQQFAQLFNIEVAPEYQDSSSPSIKVNLTLEREPYWRAIPPGANPKIWTYYVNLSHPQFNSGVASLVTGSDHLITQTIQNKAEWSPTAYGLQTTFLSQNFIDISASQVPGDAPALVEIAASVADPFANLYVGLNSKPQSQTGHDAVNRVNSLILNGGDGTTSFGTKTVVVAATGVRSNGSSVNYYNVARTSTGIDGTFVDFVTWKGNTPTGLIKLDRNFFRGTFAIFCRCRNNSAAAPLIGDMRIRLLIQQFENNANQYITSQTLQTANPPITNFGLVYMGSITIPFESRAVQSLSGYGLQIQESNPNLSIQLQQSVDVATANRTFEMIDLIFMPLDEGLAQVVPQGNSLGGGASNIVLDNTGYLSRGELTQIAVSYMSTVLSGGIGQEVRGSNIYLKPRINQRLYFMCDVGVSPVQSSPTSDMTIRLNIVPRWSGIRDT